MEQPYRERLMAALQPRSEPEQRTVAFLLAVTGSQSDVLLGMLDRAASTARAEGYESGWAEGVEYAKQHPRVGK